MNYDWWARTDTGDCFTLPRLFIYFLEYSLNKILRGTRVFPNVKVEFIGLHVQITKLSCALLKLHGYWAFEVQIYREFSLISMWGAIENDTKWDFTVEYTFSIAPPIKITALSL